MVFDTSLLNTQQYKVRINGKVEKYTERSRALPYICNSKCSKRIRSDNREVVDSRKHIEHSIIQIC